MGQNMVLQQQAQRLFLSFSIYFLGHWFTKMNSQSNGFLLLTGSDTVSECSIGQKLPTRSVGALINECPSAYCVGSYMVLDAIGL